MEKMVCVGGWKHIFLAFFSFSFPHREGRWGGGDLAAPEKGYSETRERGAWRGRHQTAPYLPFSPSP